jgi:hypothetical protein
MAVGFGTPVSANFSVTSSIVLSMSGVTSGQPIVLTVMSMNETTLPGSPVSDSFSTHYTWSLAQQISGSNGPADVSVILQQWIGYGGSGTSGTITIATTAGGYWAAQAVPCTGALTGSNPVDGGGPGGGLALLTTMTYTATANGADEGAVLAFIQGGGVSQNLTVGSGGTWSDLTFSGYITGAVQTQSNVGPGGVTGSVTASPAAYLMACGFTIKAEPTAPSAPTLVNPTASSVQTAANPIAFSATYNSTDGYSQNAYALRLKAGSGSYTYWNGTNFSSSSAVWNTVSTLPNGSFGVTIPGATLALGTTYHYSFASQESASNLQGAFASDITFSTAAATAPSAPTLVSPASASAADAASGVTFSATYNSTDGYNQSNYAMRMKIAAGTYGYWNGTDFSNTSAVWNSITTVPGGTFSVTVPNSTVVPGGTFTDGSTYDWSFASEEAGGSMQGSFASDFSLLAQAAPVVVVTAPSGVTIPTNPVVTWTETLAGGAAQTAYQVIVEFGSYGTVPGLGTQAWTSGVVTSSALTATVAVALQPQTYRVFVQINQTGSQASAWAYNTTTISGAIVEVPGTFDVGIGGHGYMIDTTFEFGRRDSFRHTSIPAQRDATDITNQPGEATINPQGLWRSEFNDWSMGSGQLFVDRKDSFPNRFHHSQGVDVFTNKWYAGLLPGTTQLVADTDATCKVLVINGYLIKLNASGVSYSSNGTSYTALTGLSGTPVAMCSDGASIYIACGTGGVYTCVAGTWTTSQLVNVASQNVYFVAYCSNVLLVANGTSLYQVSGAITSWPTALITQPEATWTWNCAAGGNGWIYLGGFAGASGSATVSNVYKTQFASDGTTLAAPTVATPLPPGEQVYSLFAFVNYILMGTSLGMRFCQTLGLIDPSGQDTGLLKIGPIIPNLQELVTKPVRCFTANQRFVYFGWSNYSASTVKATSTCTGLGWLDIATFTGDQTPAYSSNLMVSGTGEITSMDWFNGAPVFTVAGQGVYSAATTFVASGNIYSGYIAFRIQDQKILVAYSVDTTSTASSVTSSINQDDENTYPLGTVTGLTNQFAVPQIYGELFETDLTLNSTSSNTVGTTLRRATLQAYPAITAGKFIIVALRFWDSLETRAGRREFGVYSEMEFLENLRYNQTIVTYQEGTSTWSVVVDSLDFVEYMPSELPAGGFQGIMMCTLKTASSGLVT